MSWVDAVPFVLGVFLAYFVTLHLGYMALLALAVSTNRMRSREVRATDMDRVRTSDLTIPISVLIPSYNEEESLMHTVRSALASRLPEFEVIAIDDGSTDGTLDLLREEFDLSPRERTPLGEVETAPVRAVYRSRSEPRLWVVEKENGGKGDAANAGLNLARYRYVLLTDADGIFDPDALARMIRPVNYDPARIVGAGATLRPLNGCEVLDERVVGCRLPRSWLVRFQLLEYSSVFLGNRLGWSALNAVPVLSGGVSLWRKDTLRELGGFTEETTHEDLDTTLRLHRWFRSRDEDYRIVYLPDTVAWTEVPHTWRGLYQQRKRWQRTLYESVWRERRMLFNPRYGTVGMIMMPYLLLYEALGPLVEIVAYVLTVVLLVMGVADPLLLLAFLVTAAGLTAITRLASLVIDLIYYEDRSVGDLLRLSGAALLEYWVYRPFVLIARLHAIPEFLTGHTGWERAQRDTGLRRPQSSSVRTT